VAKEKQPNTKKQLSSPRVYRIKKKKQIRKRGTTPHFHSIMGVFFLLFGFSFIFRDGDNVCCDFRDAGM
jgi:hypothetical protein